MRKPSRLPVALTATAMPLLTPTPARAEWGGRWSEMLWGDTGVPAVPGLDPWSILLLLLVMAGIGFWQLRRRRGRPAIPVMLVLLAVPVTALAATISVPHTFVNGTVADADEVNANFDTLVTESNAKDVRLDALEATAITSISVGTGLTGGGSSGAIDLGVDTTAVQSRVLGQCAAGSSIRVVNPDGSVVCELDDDTNSGGDITEVTAGQGLTGGGVSGAVTLAIGAEAVTSVMLAPDSVGFSEIAADAVRGAEIDPDARDTLTVGDSSSADVDCAAGGSSIHGVALVWVGGGDDADCITAALFAAVALDIRNVVLLAGVYTVQSSILMRNGVHLQGARTSAGRSRVRIEATVDGLDVIRWQGITNAALTGIELSNAGGSNVRLVYVSGNSRGGVIRDNRFVSSFGNDDYVVVEDLSWPGVWEEFLIEENFFNNGYPSCADDTGTTNAYLVIRATVGNAGPIIAVRRNTFVSYLCEKQQILLDAQGVNLGYSVAIEQNDFTWYSQSDGASIRTSGSMPSASRGLNVHGNLFYCVGSSPVPVISEDVVSSGQLRISENTFDGCGVIHNLASAPGCLGNTYLNGSDRAACDPETPLPGVATVDLFGVTSSTTPATLDSFTVQVPGPGSLLVMIEGQIFFDVDATSANSLTSSFRLGLCDSPASSVTCESTWEVQYFQDADDVVNTNATFGFSRTRVVPVAAAGSRTFYVNASTSDPSYDVNLYQSPRAVVSYFPGSLIVTNP